MFSLISLTTCCQWRGEVWSDNRLAAMVNGHAVSCPKTSRERPADQSVAARHKPPAGGFLQPERLHGLRRGDEIRPWLVVLGRRLWSVAQDDGFAEAWPVTCSSSQPWTKGNRDSASGPTNHGAIAVRRSSGRHGTRQAADLRGAAIQGARTPARGRRRPAIGVVLGDAGNQAVGRVHVSQLQNQPAAFSGRVIGVPHSGQIPLTLPVRS